MTGKTSTVVLAGLAAALGGGFACEGCDALSPVVVASSPVNACPAHPCSAYTQEGAAPSCEEGACLVDTSVNGLLLVIELAEDSIFAPGQTYVTTLQIPAAGPDGGGPAGPCALPICTPPLCLLPPWAQDTNVYWIAPSAAAEVDWFVGTSATVLPVQATYRPLLGSGMVDAIDLGLPLIPVQSQTRATPSLTGPNMAPALLFQATLQPMCYERTLQPYSPFSRAFPPEIKPWNSTDAVYEMTETFDTTMDESYLPAGVSGRLVPTFAIGRAEGLDGWSAYLRNIATKRVFSNVAPLSGSLAESVVLATNHVTDPNGDALTGLELVIAPPSGTPIPTEILLPVITPPSLGLPEQETYPSLPVPVAMTGRVATAQGTPVAASVVFTAADIFDRSGQPFPSSNFEFATQVQTSLDPQTGESTYSVVLPRGDYEIAVRPTDDVSALHVETRSVGGPGDSNPRDDITLAARVPMTGRAAVADGRPLGGAIVEVVPVRCAAVAAVNPVPADGGFDAATTQSITVSDSSDACEPRAAQTLTATDGSFALALDPGGYWLRVRPADGSRLPWVEQSLTIAPGSDPVVLDLIRVPAPLSVGMTLTDTAVPGNPVVHAIVRVFTDPSQGGPALELGRAITDHNGNYELYIAPPAP